MKTGISISVEKESIKEMGVQILAIIKSSYDTRMEQETIMKALEVLESVCPKNTNISYNTIGDAAREVK